MEINLLETATQTKIAEDLKQKSIDEAHDFCYNAFRSQSIYIKSLSDVIKTVPPNQKQFKELLIRVSEGLQSSCRQLADGLAKTQLTYLNARNDHAFTLQSLSAEFDEYKKNNDLDSLFTKGMDITLCKSILDRVNEMIKHSDQNEIDTKIVTRAGPTDVSLHLQSVVEDYEQFMVKKLRMISENTDYEQESQRLQ